MSPTATTTLPDIVRREIDNFEAKAKAFRAGTVPDEEFKPFRLVHGTYGQRQSDVQMMRIKVPGGSMTAAQARALGDVCRDWAPLGIGHVTTRAYRMGFFTFNFGTAIDFGPLLAGAVIILIAWIMDEGRKIQEEQALTV